MAGDRSLAFVMIGLIGVSGLWVSNHRRAALGSAATAMTIVEQNQQIPGASTSTERTKTGISHVREKTSQSRFFDAIDGASYVVRGHDPAVSDLRQEAILGAYPELSGSPLRLPRIKPRLRLAEDPSPQSPGFAPPLN
jgi:hypothetical protein